MAELKKGDIVLHYADNYLRYVSNVIEPPVEASKPEVMKETEWPPEGRLVKIQYHELSPNIQLDKFSQALTKLLILIKGPLIAREG